MQPVRTGRVSSLSGLARVWASRVAVAASSSRVNRPCGPGSVAGPVESRAVSWATAPLPSPTTSEARFTRSGPAAQTWGSRRPLAPRAKRGGPAPPSRRAAPDPAHRWLLQQRSALTERAPRPGEDPVGLVVGGQVALGRTTCRDRATASCASPPGARVVSTTSGPCPVMPQLRPSSAGAMGRSMPSETSTWVPGPTWLVVPSGSTTWAVVPVGTRTWTVQVPSVTSQRIAARP